MKQRIYQYITVLSLCMSLWACGGSAGISGTGFKSKGTVDRITKQGEMTNILVNGIEFSIDSASILSDGNSVSESEIKQGIIVTVSGTVNDDDTGVATEVQLDNTLSGPITQIVESDDGSEIILTILGQKIIVNSNSTIFSDVTFGTLSVSDLVEVSGFLNTTSPSLATRIEREGSFIPNQSSVGISGEIIGLTESQFMLGELTVDFSSADLSGLGNEILRNGLTIEIEGTLPSMESLTVSATHITLDIPSLLSNEQNVLLSGIITEFVSNADFEILGQPVDASNAVLLPGNLQLGDGVQVNINGRIVDGIIIADEIESRDGRIRLGASIQSIETLEDSTRITLEFVNGTVDFIVNARTLLNDSTATFASLTLDNLQVNDFVIVRGFMDDNTIIATDLLLTEDGDQIIHGPIESFVSGESVTVFGLTYSTLGATFEDQNEQMIESPTFYSELDIGEFIEINDNAISDGIADTVEFETTNIFVSVLLIGDGPIVIGSGFAITEQRTLNTFSKVSLDAGIIEEVTILDCDHSVSITADDNIVPLISTNISNGTLTVSNSNSALIATPIVIQICMRSLIEIDSNITGNVLVNLPVSDITATVLRSGEDITINVSSVSSALTFDSISGTNCQFQVGDGDILVTSGSCTNVVADTNGSGDFSARNFSAVTTNVHLSGAGHMDITSDNVTGSLSGSGNLTVNNDATVSVENTGTGSIIFR